MQINYATVAEYCKALSSNEAEIWTWGLFDESGKGGLVPGWGKFSCPVDDLKARLAGPEINYPGAWSLHACLNQTDLDKRRTENIRGVRCLCVDLDRKVDKDEARAMADDFRPDMVVQSSPGKYHFYWRVAPTVKLDTWKIYQAGLAYKMGGDLNLSGVTHMIRVPGCARRCKDGREFTPEIVRLEGTIGMRTDVGIRESWPLILEWGEAGFEAQKRRRASVRAALPQVVGFHAKLEAVGGRNDSLYQAVNSWVYENRVADQDAAVGFALEMNQCFENPLEESEVWWVGRSAFEHALCGWQKTQKELEALLPELRDGLLEKSGVTALEREIKKEPNKSGNGHKPIETVSDVIAAVMVDADKKRNALPPALAAVVGLVVERIWAMPHEKDNNLRRQECRIIKNALSSNNYTELAYRARVWLASVGYIDRKGVVINVRETSAWGSEVLGYEVVDKEFFTAFLGEIVSRLMRRCIRVKMFPNPTGKPKDEHKVPPTSKLKQMGDYIWGVLVGLDEKRARQPGNIIVWPDGVLWLDEGRFEPNPPDDSWRSARMYSHAIDARWVPGELDFRRDCPVAAGFFQDWMPDDEEGWNVILAWIGFSMTTDFGWQLFLFTQGPAGSGKGSLSGLLCAIVGRRNFVSINYAALDGDFEEGAIYDKLVWVVEEAAGTTAQHRGRMDRLLKITGGGTVPIKRKYQKPMDDYICGKGWLQSNIPPAVMDPAGALKGRMVQVGLEHGFRGRPSLVAPKDQIIAAGECDKIATLAAKAWMKARRQPSPFMVNNSRIVRVGADVIGAQMDVVGRACRKYISVKPHSKITESDVLDLLALAQAAVGIDAVANKYEKSIMLRDVATHFDGRMKRMRFRLEGKLVSGFDNLGFNSEKIKQDFSLDGELDAYPSLAAVVGYQAGAGALSGFSEKTFGL